MAKYRRYNETTEEGICYLKLHLRATKALLTQYFLSELTLNPKPRMVKPPYDDTAPWTYRDSELSS